MSESTTPRDFTPAIYVSPSKVDAKELLRTIRLIVWIAEHAFDLIGPAVETLVLLVNYAGNTRNPSFGLCCTTLDIVQIHYLERLGLVLVTSSLTFKRMYCTTRVIHGSLYSTEVGLQPCHQREWMRL
ncbi:uncharacterized protein F5147DRAFT_392584 [Suillus discolor]|uniref:CRAL-TRIO domain-containing protein n=1 Tax=Suillus discolor TaxID=1912936 RepID=A0A9P7EXC7_9AGAM|nr:uncharacterized protein F5147DRAFT_392584 [Suillus discolor]KAG2096058.1 hypothetical protein F5147DRAFT_392584 [Suillus discolor]